MLEKERSEIVYYGRKMSEAGLCPGTNGNISIYNAEYELIAISPSGINCSEMEPDDIVLMNLYNEVVEAKTGYRASSELKLHTHFYKSRPDLRAILHTHSIFCTTFSCMNMPIKAIHHGLLFSNVPEIPCAPYKISGSILYEETLDACGKGNAVLLGNHGAVCCGTNIKEAFNLAINIEFVAEIYWRTLCIGTPNILSQQETSDALKKLENYEVL